MFLTLLKAALRLTPVFLFGSTGETLTEKSGHLNMGTPGIICCGAAGGMIGIVLYDKICGGIANAAPILIFLFCIFFALLFGALSGFIFSFFTVSLRCNQNVMGLAYTTFGIGFYGLIFTTLGHNNGDGFYNLYCSKINTLFMTDKAATGNWFNTLFLANGALWFMSFAIAVLVAVLLKRTKIGLFVRAVGENAASSDAAGINVSLIRYIVTIIGGAISALAGLYYFVEINVGFVEFGNLDGYGWLAVALVIFTLWKTDLGIIGAFLFAFLFKLPSVYSLNSPSLDMLFTYLPYFATIVILVITSIFDKKAAQAPGDLGIAYFREER